MHGIEQNAYVYGDTGYTEKLFRLGIVLSMVTWIFMINNVYVQGVDMVGMRNFHLAC